MGHKLSPPDLALYRAVDEVLFYVWDPIGVSPSPYARDEYHGYLSQVFALVRDGASEETIAGLLGAATTERMGLPLTPERDLEIARQLLEWRSVIADQYADYDG